MSNKCNSISLLRKDVEYLKREEMKNRRKLRLLQVRQQNREHASRVRENVHKKKCDEILKLAHELDLKHEEEQQAKVAAAEKVYLEGLQNVGLAYRNISNEEVAEKKLKEEQAKNEILARYRYQSAMKQLKESEDLQKEELAAFKSRKAFVIKKEKLRAKKVASLPKVLTSTIPAEKTESSSKCVKPADLIRSHHSSFYCATAIRHEGHYDAKAAAEREEKLNEGLSKERSCMSMAMLEKAELRHKAAVHQERLNQDLMILEKEIQQLRRKEQFRR